MYRYEIDAITAGVPNVPAGTPFVCLADRPTRMLLCRVVPDGTVTANNTIADLTVTTDPTSGQRVLNLDFNADALTPTQQTTIRTFLVANLPGFDPAVWWDPSPPTDRRQLARGLCRFFGFTAAEIAARFPLSGFFVDGG